MGERRFCAEDVKMLDGSSIGVEDMVQGDRVGAEGIEKGMRVVTESGRRVLRTTKARACSCGRCLDCTSFRST